MDQEIVLVNEEGEPIGTAPKLASHHRHTPLHLAFSCYIFNEDGEFLLTQRAFSKKVWPWVWTNSVCGHPKPDEPIKEAIRRRVKEELGLTKLNDLQVVLPHYRYTTPPYHGIIENEICPVYTAWTTQDPTLNPKEVEDYHWVALSDIQEEIAGAPADYSYWFKDQLRQLRNDPTFVHLQQPRV